MINEVQSVLNILNDQSFIYENQKLCLHLVHEGKRVDNKW